MTDACFAADQGLISLDEALARLLAEPVPKPDIRETPLREAYGRILARDIRSPIHVPGHNNSAMDGYAVHSADLSPDGDTRLPITQRIPAGNPGKPLTRGECARIFTGAPIPPGADAVIMQEQATVDGDAAVLHTPVHPGENIRPAGNDITANDIILTAGVRLNPGHIGLIASVGLTSVAVYERPRIAILSTGDELREPGESLRPGQIYNSNRYTLFPLLEGLGCEPLDLGRVADTRAATLAALETAAREADVILTTGGVSVGEEDHVRAAVETLGRLDLWRIAVKPGKPFAFGRIGDALFLGLPGNPVSVFVTALLLARPLLLRRMGARTLIPQPLPIAAGFSRPNPTPRREFLRVQLQPSKDDAGKLVAVPHERQSSDVLSSTAWADGLAEVPENRALNEGDPVRYYPLSSLLHPG